MESVNIPRRRRSITRLPVGDKKEEDKKEEKKEEKKDDTKEEVKEGRALYPGLFAEEDDDHRSGNLIDDFQALFRSGRLTDVVFIVGEKKEEVKAHRLVVAAGSPILAEMVFPNELESADIVGAAPLRIVIDDKAEVFKLLLECIYTNKAELEHDQLADCIAIARKYCCSRLQFLCSDFMESGLTAENVFILFNDAPRILGDKNFAMDFIAENAKDLFATEYFHDLEPERLAHILDVGELKMNEREVWASVLDWGGAQILKIDEDEDPEDSALLKEHLKPLVPHVRFPLFRTHDFSELVAKTGVMDEGDLIELFTYMSCREAKVPEEEMPKTKWKTEPRCDMGFTFIWSRCGTRSAISNEGLTHSSTSGGYSCAIGDTPMEPGTGNYYWEVKMDRLQSGSWQCAVGVGTEHVGLNTYLSASSNGWAYFNGGWRAHASGSGGDTYGGPYSEGVIIGCLFNSDTGSLYFYKGGASGFDSLGLCFSGINQTVYPASHVNNGVTATINQEITPPADAM